MEHYLYLVAVSEACGGVDNLVINNIVHYADPATKISLFLRLNLTRTDVWVQWRDWRFRK